MTCPNDYCKGKLEVNDTDQYSTYYCQDCGYEDRVVWPTPVKKKRQRFTEPTAPRRKAKRKE
jgi:hypothetical protein